MRRFSAPVEFYEAWKHSKLPRNAFLLGCSLAGLACDDPFGLGVDRVAASSRSLAHELGVSEATARNLLHRLEAEGWISCSRTARGKSWLITLTGLRQSAADLPSEEELLA